MRRILETIDARTASITTTAPNGSRAVVILGEDAVDYYVTDAGGALVWTATVTDGPRAQAHREAIAREQERRFTSVRSR